MTFDRRLLEEPDIERRLDSIIKQTSYRYTKVPERQVSSREAFGISTLVTGALMLVMGGAYIIELAIDGHNYREGYSWLAVSAMMIGFGEYVRRTAKADAPYSR